MNEGTPNTPVASRPAPVHDGLVGGSLSDGWNAFKYDPVVLVGFVILKAPLAALAGWLLSGGWYAFELLHPYAFGHLGELRRTMLGIFTCLLDGFLTVGMLYSALRVLRRQATPFTQLFSGFTKPLPVLIAYILVNFAVGIGILFLIIPGIIIALVLSQWQFLIMDRNADGVEAVSGSWRLMKGHVLDYFLLWVVLIFINLAGAIPVGLGLFVTVPYTYAVQAAFYNRIAGSTEAEPESSREPLVAPS
ncbi:DUF975 family protein [Candidatus Eisenbacteria bacterium]|uniref:DUF975 family protein n=1 Tax=Eiseniibacteriota bacterium TaxID=2212470 RepID=A0ABV6YJU7_UNCEI